MNYLLGYISNRTGVPLLHRQKERLIKFGVLENDIYENLEDCIESLRGLEHKRDKKGKLILDDKGHKIIIHEPDSLVVYTTAILGKNKINPTFDELAHKLIEGVYSIKSDDFYKCASGKEGIKTLSRAWGELEDCAKEQMASVGREKGGRNKSEVWKYADEICTMRKTNKLPIVIDMYKQYEGGTESTIRRILKAGGME